MTRPPTEPSADLRDRATDRHASHRRLRPVAGGRVSAWKVDYCPALCEHCAPDALHRCVRPVGHRFGPAQTHTCVPTDDETTTDLEMAE